MTPGYFKTFMQVPPEYRLFLCLFSSFLPLPLSYAQEGPRVQIDTGIIEAGDDRLQAAIILHCYICYRVNNGLALITAVICFLDKVKTH